MQYNALKYAVLSGGVNHIDTGHTFRRHRAEFTVATALTTLFQKYGLTRDEVFINTKQGFVGHDSIMDLPVEA